MALPSPDRALQDIPVGNPLLHEVLQNSLSRLSYICPACGATVDVADGDCPHCAARGHPDSDETAEITAEAAPKPLSVEERPRRRKSMGLRARHYWAFAGVLAASVIGAFVVSEGLPGLRFEEPGEAEESPVETFAIGVRGPIEVSGIRPYYDDEYQAHVRAFVANHSRDAQSVALAVLLRIREASQQAPPLATFEVLLSDPLPPNGGREVDVGLQTMGTLESLPPWHQLRVDLEVLAARGNQPL